MIFDSISYLSASYTQEQVGDDVAGDDNYQDVAGDDDNYNGDDYPVEELEVSSEEANAGEVSLRTRLWDFVSKGFLIQYLMYLPLTRRNRLVMTLRRRRRQLITISYLVQSMTIIRLKSLYLKSPE